MNKYSIFYSTLLLFTPVFAQASPFLTVGTSANSQLATPTAASPVIGNLINFDSLTPNTAFDPASFASVGVTSIASPDGLQVEPFSSQTFPDELVDLGAGGTANITINLAAGAGTIGIGIADSDAVSVTFQALAADGSALGSPFTEDLASTTDPVNTGNGYYVIQDTTADIFGLQITQALGDPNFSGLAIDDLQFAATAAAPEPSSVLFLMAGVAFATVIPRKFRKQS